jgi:DNA-binding beta-propeller fold protein YncE
VAALAISISALGAGLSLAASGSLTVIQRLEDGAGRVDGLNSVSDVQVSPDGQHVYSAACADNAVAVFERRGDGKLDFVEAERNGRNGVRRMGCPTDVALSPDGEHAYVPGDALVVFSRKDGSGALKFVEAEEGTGLDIPYDAAVARGGKHVYLTDRGHDSVFTFSRNPATGRLTFVEEDDGVGDAGEVEVSGDGKNVYVAAAPSDVVTFSRNRATGSLTELERDDTRRFPAPIAIPRDQESVYVGQVNTGGIAVFARNETTGALTSRGIADSPNQGGATGLAISPDGNNVYATAGGMHFGPNMVAIFARAANGSLRFVEQVAPKKMKNPAGIAISPDGDNAYVAALVTDTLLAFARGSTGRTRP